MTKKLDAEESQSDLNTAKYGVRKEKTSST
jgi:hypothetical protein